MVKPTFISSSFRSVVTFKRLIIFFCQNFAWKTKYDIVAFTIPALVSLIDEQQSLPQSADTLTRITTLQNAIDGWNSALNRVQKLHDDAATGEIKSTVASIVSVDGFDTSKNALIADSLLTSPYDSSNLVRSLDGQSVDSTPVKAFSAFGFTGGGQKIEFTEAYEFDNSYSEGKGRDFSITFSAGFTLDIAILSLGPKLGLSGGYTRTDSVSEESQVENTASVSRSFSLGDPDAGDEFVVKVC
jgi:hypothetical protein